MSERKMTEARRAFLEEAASPRGLEWYSGNASKSRNCNALFKAKLVAWGFADRDGRQERVLVATPAGREALAKASA